MVRRSLELESDFEADAVAASARIATSDFDTNPIGVKVEPKELLHRFRAGEGQDALFERRRIDASLAWAQLPHLT